LNNFHQGKIYQSSGKTYKCVFPDEHIIAKDVIKGKMKNKKRAILSSRVA